jgi:hypothetical protein
LILIAVLLLDNPQITAVKLEVLPNGLVVEDKVPFVYANWVVAPVASVEVIACPWVLYVIAACWWPSGSMTDKTFPFPSKL